MYNLDALFFGLLIGLAGAIPVGPVNLVVIRSALKRGLWGGLVSGLGSVACDALFAAIAAFGVQSIQNFIAAWSQPISIIGGLALIMVGVRTTQTHIRPKDIEAGDQSISVSTAGRKIATTFGLSITNPATLLFVFATFGSMSAVLHLHSSPIRPVLAVVGAALGSFLWWFFISYIVSLTRGHFSTRTLDLVNRWSGVLVAALGFVFLFDALRITVWG